MNARRRLLPLILAGSALLAQAPPTPPTPPAPPAPSFGVDVPTGSRV